QHFTPFNSAITYNSLGTRKKKYQQWANNCTPLQISDKTEGLSLIFKGGHDGLAWPVHPLN
ncbi:MAG: hypothetical protein V4721_16280, partial [Bacteroidota bacterium]